MKRLLIGAAGLSLLLTGCPELAATNGKACVSKNYSPSEIFQKAAPSIVVIAVGESLGSGFVIKQDKRFTYILTNSHVVDGAEEVKVKWSDDREETGKVTSDHGGETWQKDLALVRVDGVRGEPLKFKETPPAVGEDVVVIGAPQGLEFSLSRGVMSQLRNNGDFLQVDAPVNPGNSGGPLFDKTGCVVGVVTFKDEDSEGINFAIGYGPTKHFLENPAIERPEPKPEPVASEPQPEQPTGWYKFREVVTRSRSERIPWWHSTKRQEVLIESIRLSGPWVNFSYRQYRFSAPVPGQSRMNASSVKSTEEQKSNEKPLGIDCGRQVLRHYPFTNNKGFRNGLEDYQLVGSEWWTADEIQRGYSENDQSKSSISVANDWTAIYKAVCTIVQNNDMNSFPLITEERYQD